MNSLFRVMRIASETAEKIDNAAGERSDKINVFNIGTVRSPCVYMRCIPTVGL